MMSQCKDVYTEDGVLVKKLHLFNFKKQLSLSDLEEILKKFGDIKEIHYRGCDSKQKTAFVTFNDASSAAKTLSQLNKPEYAFFKAKPSYSWQQPDAFNFLGNCGSDPPHPILNLNDDCLGQILRLLTLSDRIRFARTYQRICGVYQDMSKALHKSVDITELANLTKWEVSDFFMICGPHVEKINGIKISNHHRFLTYLNKNCTNLQSLEIETWRFSLQECNYFNIDADMPVTIESLELDNCDLLDIYNIIMITDAYPQLKELQIRIVDRPFNQFNEVRRFIKVMSAKVNNLKKLTVFGNYSNGGSSRFINSYAKINKLRALRTLRLSSERITNNILSELITLPELEELNLTSTRVTDTDLFELILACPKLQLVYLYHCVRITNKLIDNLASELREKMKEIGNSRSIPIKLYVHGTEITKLSLYDSDADIIVLVFDQPDLKKIK